MVHWDGLTIQTDTIKEAMALPADKRAELAPGMAFKAGMEAFFVVGSVMAAGSVYANFKIPAYKRNLGASGKVMTCLIPATMSYALFSDQLSARMAAPERFAAAEAEKKQHAATLPLHKRTANWLYENPVKSLAATGIPAVVGIFSYQSRDKFMTASQKVMHTRVIGQATVLALLVSTMAFQDTMSKRGGAFKVTDGMSKDVSNTEPAVDEDGHVV